MTTARSSARAALIEIFHSIQGEGRYVGEPMTFVRVATCPLRCRYCDTPGSWRAGRDFPVHGLDRTAQNPIDADAALELARQVAARSPFVPVGAWRVSMTGGEPLVYPEFVRDFGASLGDFGRLHLETAAHDADALATCLPVISHLSADWKLPETLESGDFTAQHRACIEAAARGSNATIDVKVVLTGAVRDESFAAMLDALQLVRDRVLLVLQPVTPARNVSEPLAVDRLEQFTRVAGRVGFVYRVVPQTHPLLRLR
jgi:organic radical activating enzyme